MLCRLLLRDTTFTGRSIFPTGASFTNAATIIQTALNANLPVAATTTRSSIAPLSVSFTGESGRAGIFWMSPRISSGGGQNGAICSRGWCRERLGNFYSRAGGRLAVLECICFLVAGGMTSSETMTESYGVLTVGSPSSGTVARMASWSPGRPAWAPLHGNQIQLKRQRGRKHLAGQQGSDRGGREHDDDRGASQRPLHCCSRGFLENRGYFSIQQNGNLNIGNSASLTYAGGTAAWSLGLTQASGAFDSSPGGTGAPLNKSAWMNNLVQTENDQFGSFETFWPQLMQAAPEEQDALRGVGSVYGRRFP